MKTNIIILGIGILITTFIGIGFMVSQPQLSKFVFESTGDFKNAFWNVRRMDVLIQIVLIFTASLGVLTFFAERGSK